MLPDMTVPESGIDEHALRAQQLRDAAPVVQAWRERATLDAEELADIFGEDVA